MQSPVSIEAIYKGKACHQPYDSREKIERKTLNACLVHVMSLMVKRMDEIALLIVDNALEGKCQILERKLYRFCKDFEAFKRIMRK